MFIKMEINYGQKWITLVNSPERAQIAREMWEHELQGFDLQIIEEACKRAISDLEWPPSITEFKNCCESLIGMPGLEYAYQAALRRDFACGFTRACFNRIGNQEFRNASDKALRKRFEAVFNEVLSGARRYRIENGIEKYDYFENKSQYRSFHS